MLLIGVADLQLATRLHIAGAGLGRRVYAVSVDRLMHLCGAHKPAVVLLDTRLGGMVTRSVESIPTLLGKAPGARVVVLSRCPSQREIREAVDLGAYAVVDTLDVGLGRRIDEIIYVARRTRGVHAWAPLWGVAAGQRHLLH